MLKIYQKYLIMNFLSKFIKITLIFLSLSFILGILEEIQAAEPTDGLWSDGRTDTDQLGMSYKEIEFLMDRPSEPGYEKYLEIRKKNLHKMKSIPICKFDGKISLDADPKKA